MDTDETAQADANGIRTVTVVDVRAMLASLQEAVVTADAADRRTLLKEVITQLQNVLAGGTRR